MDILKDVPILYLSLTYVKFKQLFQIRSKFSYVIRVWKYMYYFQRIFNGDQ